MLEVVRAAIQTLKTGAARGEQRELAGEAIDAREQPGARVTSAGGIDEIAHRYLVCAVEDNIHRCHQGIDIGGGQRFGDDLHPDVVVARTEVPKGARSPCPCPDPCP